MRLLGISGKKQSGKDTVAKFLMTNAQALFGTNGFRNEIEPLDFGGQRVICHHYRQFYGAKTYYFGQAMKDFAEKFLGVSHELLWGTDEQKSTVTSIKWESLPHYPRLLDKWLMNGLIGFGDRCRTGPMTIRELLQQIGEEMFLDMNPRCWVDQFAAEVKADSLSGTVVFGASPDVRRPADVDTIKRLGGKTIRLFRNPFGKSDQHYSEVALDPDRYDQSKFDGIIDNHFLTIRETNLRVVEMIRGWGWTPEIQMEDIVWQVQP